MASAIHHGPPGSFKSFTLVQLFAIEALKQGRVVVTNVRGLTSVDRIIDAFPDDVFPATADIIFINTDNKKNRPVFARWFHWVPIGALVIMDEAQRIYPKRRDFKLESLDIPMVPDGFQVDTISIEIYDEYKEQTYIVERPDNIADAFDMQRHFNWDIYLSTPHINKVLDPIREVCQAAYRHKSLSELLPFIPYFKNAWYEFKHDPDNTGKLLTHIAGKPIRYKADERIFQCYESTATGEHSKGGAEKSVLTDPKIRFLLFVLVCTFGAMGVNVYHRIERSKQAEAVAVSSSAVTASSSASVRPGVKAAPGAPSVVSPGGVPARQDGGFFDSLGYRLVAVAFQHMADKANARLAFVVDTLDGLRTVQFSDLAMAGVRASVHKICAISLISPDGKILKVGCASPVIRGCSASVNTADMVIRRDCYKYGEKRREKQPLVIPQNALVATASAVMPELHPK
jgi:zona occludens toxin